MEQTIVMSQQERKRISNRIFVGALVANFVLMLFKFLAGVIGHSGAMLSDAVHTLSDVGTTLMAMFGIRMAGRESDDDHPYGHERIESVIGLLLAVVLLLTAVFIGWNGIEALFAGGSQSSTPGIIALVAALASIATQEVLYHISIRGSRKIDSPAMAADAWHHRSDALSSVGSLIGIAAARMGLWFMDPIASLVICLLILKVGISIAKDSIRQLIDASAPPEMVEAMRQTVLSVQGVDHIDRMRSRMHANRVYVEIEIAIPKHYSFEDAHAIAERVHRQIEKQHPKVLHCTVHANPCSEGEANA